MESKIETIGETIVETTVESKTESKKWFSWATCCAGMAEEPAEIVKAAKAGVGDVTVQEILEKIAEEIIPASDVAKATSVETTPQTKSV